MNKTYLIKQQILEQEIYQRYGVEFDFEKLFVPTGYTKKFIQVRLQHRPNDNYEKHLILEYLLDITPAGYKKVTIERKEEM